MNAPTLTLWLGRLLAIAVFVVAGAALFTAESLGGSTYGAAALGVVFGVGLWWVLVFGPEWADGQR